MDFVMMSQDRRADLARRGERGHGFLTRTIMQLKPGQEWRVPDTVCFASARAVCAYLSKKHQRRYVARCRKATGDRSVARLY